MFWRNFNILKLLVWCLLALIFAFIWRNFGVSGVEADSGEIVRARLVRPSPEKASFQVFVDEKTIRTDLDRALVESSISELNWLRNVELSRRVDIREKLLKHLTRLFSENDWLQWPGAFENDSSAPTLARRFVDSVYVLNPELGRYLETAGYVIKSIRAEAGTTVEDSLREMTSRSEELFEFRVSPAVRAETRVYASLASDKAFKRLLRDITIKRVNELLAFRDEPLDVELLEQLLRDLRPPAFELVITKALGEIPKSENGASRRVQLATVLRSMPVIKNPNELNESFRANLSKFFALVSIDLLIGRNLATSAAALELSTDLFSLPEIQTRIYNSIAQIRGAGQEKHAESDAEGFSELARSSSQAASRGIVSILVKLIIFGLILFIAIKSVLGYWNRRDVRVQRGGEDIMDEFGQDNYSSSDDSEIEFDSLGDLDGFLDANR